ncbi:hypothetical protein V500_08378 [Pseudogymnoascus sp. VKM F-4518 (FW-2643)]|nr:hypothetical protein V500_08378 [Pseudogymnoascus sp. VKM F-4518 (FW-2643)]
MTIHHNVTNQQSATQLNQSSNKLEQSSTNLKQADTALKESAHHLKHDADQLKQAANQPHQTANSLDQASSEVRQATQQFTLANAQLKKAAVEVKQAAEGLKQATGEFNRAAEKLGEDVEEFLWRVGFVDWGGLGEEDLGVGEVVRGKIGGVEEGRSRLAVVELIDVLDRYAGDLDNVMILDVFCSAVISSASVASVALNSDLEFRASGRLSNITMSETTGNTTEPSGDNTAPPDTPSGMQARQFLAQLEQHNNLVQQDLAQSRQGLDRLYQIIGKLEKAAGPFSEIAVQYKQSASSLMEAVSENAEQANLLNGYAVQYRELVAFRDVMGCKELDAISATLLGSFERYKVAGFRTVAQNQRALAEKQYENLEWLMVVESIVRPTNTSD